MRRLRSAMLIAPGADRRGRRPADRESYPADREPGAVTQRVGATPHWSRIRGPEPRRDRQGFDIRPPPGIRPGHVSGRPAWDAPLVGITNPCAVRGRSCRKISENILEKFL